MGSVPLFEAASNNVALASLDCQGLIALHTVTLRKPLHCFHAVYDSLTCARAVLRRVLSFRY